VARVQTSADHAKTGVEDSPLARLVLVRRDGGKAGQWMQYWHPCGRLSGSCRPEAERCAVRAYRPHRAILLEYRAAPMQHMHKALHQMNGPLTHVLTDSTGATGLAMIHAMVAGERDPVRLAWFRGPHAVRAAPR
jgi:transposase